MKNASVYIAIVAIGAAGAAQAGGRPARCGQVALAGEFAAPQNLAYPSFCDIPPAPKSVRTASAFKSEVVDVRIAGRDLAAETGLESWSLSGTEDFASAARREAEPPPPMSSPTPGGAEAFVKQSQALTTPPPKHRRRHP